MPFSADLLKIDYAAEADRIGSALKTYLTRVRRKGIVLGLSGGIDSTVTATLAVRALGPERVFGVLMPERHSEDDTLRLSRLVAESLGIKYELEVITDILEAAGCYRRYDQAVREVIPQFDSSWKSKVTINAVGGAATFNYFNIVAQSPDGQTQTERLPLAAYLQIVASTNFKQRTRKMLEYYHADRLNFAVAGTPNRQEYDQGFFVKNGDGSADIKPIAHLYKTQVYALAAHLDVPKEVQSRPPTTDTYSLPQSQEEFYFSVPYAQMDLCMLGKNIGAEITEVAAAANLTVDQVRHVWADIDRKRQTTRYLHEGPVLASAVPEILH